MKCKLGIVFGLSMIFLTGCATTETGAQLTQNHSSSSLEQVIADKGCDASFQCKVIAVGERLTCGGPSRYLVYSSRNVNEDDVERAAKAVTLAEQADNKDKIASEICEPVLPIQALCISNTCKSIVLK
ncbi:hypothetical protein [Pseudoalteromonas luteoviolacea]|uniref:DUF4189 domain-containing protein n=1 Tax=Pseudoalteromonas luteoviolacea H33 TaxID=1365251 RepID=A0A161XWU4_9GAMM|nr:hypothetical protein [Pseudoalteromonas luteoviolacea]KZN47719.1 hypothetical protein N476_23230 [Pseudoalteromonas luteoviolacea H33]KZN75754.1 hypothetical protein N477_17555 [Pseudoalteromonas luteoviolacea H33-S]MBQ4879173.1 hypothetical protein [Pseudoalteromonas luteoviolacea]MBQ4908233.1 hypothetical protein [Pseudoalteromonas luteoviolacea]